MKPKHPSPSFIALLLALLAAFSFAPAAHAAEPSKPNVLFIIADDLTSTALSCYGNTVCKTPNIDRLAAQGTRFTHALCNATYCAPSRASFMSGYYPHGTGVLGRENPRRQIGDRATWSQHFINNGYYAARVSKIFHMGVPGDIETGKDAKDDKASWTERFNSQGPEWKAPGDGETLENNPDGKKPVMGGNTFVVVAADGDDMVHSDGRTAAKAVELIQQHAAKPFFLAIGFVRPHVPFVSPRKYHEAFLPYDKLPLPEKIPGDWDDIPKAGINYKTSVNMKMDEARQHKAIGGYYAAVTYMDAQVGKVLDALEKSGQAGNTIVVFTADHGFHLGEHDFWAKVSLHDESAKVPLIIKVPGKKAAVCHSFVELLDLYPTTAKLCGLDVPAHLQGKDISKTLDDPSATVRDAAFSVSPQCNGFLLRDDKWAFIQYAEDASNGLELYDMAADPKQYTNLAGKPEFAAKVTEFQAKLKAKLAAVRSNDLDLKKTRARHADGESAEQVAADKPNICFLLADDLRTGCLGVLGDPIVKTPNLDKVCKDGFIFRNTYVMGANASAVCFPSRQMILRGVSYLRPGFMKNDTIPTLAETFRKAGYVSMRAGKGKNGDEVFDENQDGNHSTGNADHLVGFIQKNAGGKKPLFLYMAGHEPHDPQYAPDSSYPMYQPADMPMPVSFLPYHPFDTGALLEADEIRTLKWPRTKEALQAKWARYYASITYWDAEAGRVIEALKQTGQYENTLFVVSSDNGLSMGDHGLMGKQNLYEFGGMHSFAIFAGPGIPKGDSKALTYLMDIYPTLCELTHTAIPENLDGKSLLPVIAGKSAQVRDTLITGFKNNQRSIRDDRWKLIRYPLINKTQLFDLQSDPHEMTDLSDKPEQAERIKALMAALEEKLKFYGDKDPLAVKDPAAATWDPSIGEAELAKRAAQKPKKKRSTKGALE